jgi:hypothetical protein
LLLKNSIFVLSLSDESLVMDRQRAKLNVLQRASLEGGLADISWYVTSHLEAHSDGWNSNGVQQLLHLIGSTAK